MACKKLGKSFGTVNTWCLNKTQPGLKTLYSISEVLSVDLKDLIVDKIVNSKKTSHHNDKQ